LTKVLLNKRLSLVGEKVLSHSQVLDVGCDHALLDIFLVQRGEHIRAVASDIKEGPLAHAKDNIHKYGLDGEIETRLGPGIQTIDKDIDTVVVSGMGGLNIVGIFKYSTQLLKSVKRIILSPNNYAKEVREEISKLGFYLLDEDLVEERGFIYPVMVFELGKNPYRKKEFTYSPVLLKKKSCLFQKYLEEQKRTKEQILKVMPKKYFWRRFELKREVRELERILESNF